MCKCTIGRTQGHAGYVKARADLSCECNFTSTPLPAISLPFLIQILLFFTTLTNSFAHLSPASHVRKNLTDTDEGSLPGSFRLQLKG